MVRPWQDGPICGKMMGSHVEAYAGRAEAGRRNDEFPNDECRMSTPQVSDFIRHLDICECAARLAAATWRDLCQLLFA